MTEPRRDDRPDVVVLSTADWDNPFWTNKQHVAAQLAARGHRVLYMESLGLRSATAAARDLGRMGRRLLRGLRGPRQVRPNLWVVSPLALPLNRLAAARALNRWLVPAMVRAAARHLGFRRPWVWAYNPVTVQWLDTLGPSAVIYHCVDDLGAIPGIGAAMIHSAERQLCVRAHAVFCTSNTLHDRLEPLAPGRTHLLPNVADYTHFSRARSPAPLPPELAAIPEPRLGFVGALSEYKVDFALLSALATARPDWHLVLIGQVGEGQPGTSLPLPSLPNIHLLGPRAYGALPDYLRGFQAALLPMQANDYTAAMFPMKFFEYLGAGLPVVSTPLPALAAYGEVCRFAHGPEAFAAAVADILSGRRPDPAACDTAARRHSWEWRLDQMEHTIRAATET